MTTLLSEVIGTLTSRERLLGRLRVSLFRNAIYLMISNALTGAFGLVFWLVAAKFYVTEDVGLASAAISAMLLLSLLANFGLDYALIRFLPGSGKDSKALVNSCLTITALASVIIALIFIAGLSFWSPALLFMRKDAVFLCAFVVSTVGWTAYWVIVRTFIAGRRSDFSLAQGIIFNLLRLALVIVFASFVAAFGIFVSWGIAALVAFSIGALVLLPRVQSGYRPLPVIKWQVMKEMMHFSFSNYIASLLWYAPALVLPLMVVNLVGAEANAYFYIAWSIASVLFAIPLSVSFSLFAEGSHSEGELSRNIRRSLIFTFVVVVPAILLIVLIGDKLLLLFAPDYAENSHNLLRVLAVSAAPLSLNYIYFAAKRVEMRMKGVVILSAFITIATLSLSWLLLAWMGVVGVGIAWLSSQSVAALALIIRWRPLTGRQSSG